MTPIKEYVSTLVAEKWITAEVAERFFRAYDQLVPMIGKRCAPTVGLCGDYLLIATWDRGRRRFEMELTPEGLEFFYKERSSGFLWDLDTGDVLTATDLLAIKAVLHEWARPTWFQSLKSRLVALFTRKEFNER